MTSTTPTRLSGAHVQFACCMHCMLHTLHAWHLAMLAPMVHCLLFAASAEAAAEAAAAWQRVCLVKVTCVSTNLSILCKCLAILGARFPCRPIRGCTCGGRCSMLVTRPQEFHWTGFSSTESQGQVTFASMRSQRGNPAVRLQACQMLCVAVAGPGVAAPQQTTGLKCVYLNDNCFLLAHSLSPCASPVSDEIGERTTRPELYPSAPVSHCLRLRERALCSACVAPTGVAPCTTRLQQKLTVGLPTRHWH